VAWGVLVWVVVVSGRRWKKVEGKEEQEEEGK